MNSAQVTLITGDLRGITAAFLLSPMIAALAMSFSATSVIGNALWRR